MAGKKEAIQRLREEIMGLEGYSVPKQGLRVSLGLGPLEASFPGNTFPTGTVHEFISQDPMGAEATNGFIAGLLGILMQRGGFCLWISNKCTLFPPSLTRFGTEPDKFVFVDVAKEKDVLWAVEQGLKCGALAAVVGELKEISFAESQRLQLAVEQSRVTGFLHRCKPRRESPLACVSRWKVSPLRSGQEEGLPGLGFPRWEVQLVKIRNGKPGTWQVEWRGNGFRHVPFQKVSVMPVPAKGRHYA